MQVYMLGHPDHGRQKASFISQNNYKALTSRLITLLKNDQKGLPTKN
jgi:hypothetical protein